MQIRRHKDIIAIKEGSEQPIGFHAKNLEVAELSDLVWESMAPTTLENSFVTFLESNEVKDSEGLNSLDSWLQETNLDTITRSPSEKVRSLMINVTQICNLHCTYCAAGGDGTYGDPVAKLSLEKAFPQIKFLIEKLSAGSAFDITFLGGEPLLYPEVLKAVADYAKEIATSQGIEISFTVVTNATLLNEKTISILEGMKAHVNISIDGRPAVQDKLRPQKNGKGSSDAAVKGLSALMARRQNLGTILMRAVFTTQHTGALDTYLYFNEFNPDIMDFSFDIEESERESNLSFLSEMSKVAALAFKNGGEDALRKIAIFGKYFDALDNQVRIDSHCGSGKSLLSMDSRAQMYPCPLEVGHKDEALGYVNELNTERLSSLQQPFIEKNNCQSCWARFLCGGGCLYSHKSLTGSKHKKHTNFCERTRGLIALSILYYEKVRK